MKVVSDISRQQWLLGDHTKITQVKWLHKKRYRPRDTEVMDLQSSDLLLKVD